MNYQINLGMWKSVFAVPADVVDKHLKLADERKLKVMLYLLRYNDSISKEQLSSALGLDEETIEDALLFWQQRGLFTQSDGQLAPVQDAPAEQNPQEVKPQAKPATSRVIPAKSTHLTPSEIAARLRDNKEVKYMFTLAEACLGHPLTHTEQRSLMAMHDYLGLPIDVILMIIEYAQSVGVTSARYIETIATNWADLGITDHHQAEAQICRLKRRDSVQAKIKSVCGINRRLTPKESEFASKWMEEWNMDISLVELAYQRTAENTGKLSFGYMNKILEGWQKSGITTAEQAIAELESRKRKTDAKTEKSASYDIDEFERMALLYTPTAPEDIEK